MNIKTNLGKTKAEIIFELLISLNKGGANSHSLRIEYAINQYNKLVEEGIIVELD